MKYAGLGGIALLYGLIFISSVSSAKERATGNDEKLRRSIGGAWRSIREKPQLDVERDSKTNLDDASEKPAFRGMRMDVVAKRLAELDQVLYFDGDLCVIVSDGHQMVSNIRYEGGMARRTDAFTGLALPGGFTLEDGMLVMRIPSTDFIVRYRRLDEIPDSVRLDAYELGSRQPDDAEHAVIQKEIARRMEQDQAVRSKSGFDEAAIKAMVSVDQENTKRMVELIQDVGWLSKARFGPETRHGAFLIVQHSGSIRLMRTVLPCMALEVKHNRELGQSYALLYDRLHISLGQKQRYGSQAQPNPDGSQTIGRLEDRTRVDEWRNQMGMEPLEAYAKGLERLTGMKVHIGE